MRVFLHLLLFLRYIRYPNNNRSKHWDNLIYEKVKCTRRYLITRLKTRIPCCCVRLIRTTFNFGKSIWLTRRNDILYGLISFIRRAKVISDSNLLDCREGEGEKGVPDSPSFSWANTLANELNRLLWLFANVLHLISNDRKNTVTFACVSMYTSDPFGA